MNILRTGFQPSAGADRPAEKKGGAAPASAAAAFGICILLAAVVSGVSGQESRPAGTAPRTPPAVEPGYAAAARVPDRLLDQRPRQVVVLPSEPGEGGAEPRLSSGALARVTPEKRRLPEGYVVAARRAFAERTEKWLTLRLEPMAGAPDAPPLRVLPNKLLAIVEAVLEAASAPPVFVVTGRVTEFQGENYILLEAVAEAPRVDAAPADGSPPGGEVASKASPDSGGEAVQDDGGVRAEDIVRQLMQSRPLRSVVLPELRPAAVATAPAGGPTAPAGSGESRAEGSESALWPEETMLADRAGRVIAGEDGWMLVFEDRGAEARLRPIRLLPNRLLETAIALTGDGAAGVVLLVSGEVTEYRRMNYLLLRKVLVRPDLGNLR